jgi:Fic-DOC domain mobile mystery protein B
MKFEYPSGATPIDPDEASGLIPTHITLQSELNEYEQANILEATEWAFTRRRGDPLDSTFVHTLHQQMFRHVWKWAGERRRSAKNIGVRWYEIPIHLRLLLDDTRMQIERKVAEPIEIAARFHHRLVAVHVFPNGNGRHARLLSDLLLDGLVSRHFDWGRNLGLDPKATRDRYINSLRAADAGDYAPLFAFLKMR